MQHLVRVINEHVHCLLLMFILQEVISPLLCANDQVAACVKISDKYCAQTDFFVLKGIAENIVKSVTCVPLSKIDNKKVSFRLSILTVEPLPL